MHSAPFSPDGIVYPNAPDWVEKGGIRFLPPDAPFKFPDGVFFSGSFSNGTVLQRGTDKGGNPASVYGRAPPKSSVTLTLNQEDGSYSKAATISAASNGDWKWTLPEPMKAGGNFTFVVSCDQCTQKAFMFNVTFGDVWFCAGQSNMELAMQYTISRNDSWAALQNGSYRNIRILAAEELNMLDEDMSFVIPPNRGGEWKIDISKEDFMNFAAVCWYFGQELTNALGEDAPPIGLVHAAIGGTMVEGWTKNNTLNSCDNSQQGRAWICDTHQTGPSHTCGGLFNGMVSPYVNTTIKGVLWWQGENNMGMAKGNIIDNSGYACMFLKMINQWIDLWSDTQSTTPENFGFGVVLLAYGTDAGGRNMSDMRWAQTQNYGVIPNPAFPNGFMATAHDLGDPWNGKSCWAHGPWGTRNRCSGWDKSVPFSSTRTNYYMGSIHTRVKLEVGRRLVVAALPQLYGRKELPVSGPTISSCNVTNSNGNLEFVIQFNTTMMNPKGMVNGGQNAVVVSPPASQAGSVLKPKFNDTLIPIYIQMGQEADGMLGIARAKFPLQGIKEMPNELQYMWDADSNDGGCCPGQNIAVWPCAPRSCPIMQRYNITVDPMNFQVGLEAGLPANPFKVQLVWDETKKFGRCKCFPPQVCG